MAAETTIEVRPNDNNTIDEICVHVDGHCVLHVEQMSDGIFWFGIYEAKKNGKQLGSGHFSAKSRNRITLTCETREKPYGLNKKR